MKFRYILVFFLGLVTSDRFLVYGQRREDVINDWIRRIRQAPKGHSLSPSWSTKSRIPVIGVGRLPLQNEAEDTAFGAPDHFSGPSRQPPVQFSRDGKFQNFPKKTLSFLVISYHTKAQFVVVL